MIIGITGLPGSGKTEVGRILGRRGFRAMELGDIVYEIMRERGVAITQKNVGMYATRLRRELGKAFTVREIVKRINSKEIRKAAIVGIRSQYEMQYLKSKLKGFTSIGVVAPKRLRYERIKKRDRRDDSTTRPDFEKRERRELGYGIDKAIEGADYIVINTGTKLQLKKDIYRIIGMISP
jgi:dephospho-CoA kinase